MSTYIKSKRDKMSLEEFRELFEQMCTLHGTDMKRILINCKVMD